MKLAAQWAEPVSVGLTHLSFCLRKRYKNLPWVLPTKFLFTWQNGFEEKIF